MEPVTELVFSKPNKWKSGGFVTGRVLTSARLMCVLVPSRYDTVDFKLPEWVLFYYRKGI